MKIQTEKQQKKAKLKVTFSEVVELEPTGQIFLVVDVENYVRPKPTSASFFMIMKKIT